MEFILVPVLLLSTILAAIVTSFCLMRFMHVVRSEGGFLPHIFYISTFVTVLQIISVGRNLFVDTDTDEINLGNLSYAIPSYVIWISRITTTLVLYAACQRLASRLMHYGSKPNTPTLLIITFLFFFFTNVFTAASFSAHPSFEHYYVYFVLAGTASLLFAQGEEEISIRAARNALFIFLIISAGFIPWNPGLVLSNNYLEGLIPGLTYRYAGLAPHPNFLGINTVLFLLCLWNKPFSSRWINFFGWTIGYLSLVLAQSKTSWICFIICMSCMGYFKYGDLLKQRLFDVKNPILPATFILITIISSGIISGVVMFSDIGSKINSFFSTPAGAELMTMTGRTNIWEIALNEWRNNPFFGYGLTIFDEAHRAKTGTTAFHAHNQFYQTLASAGIVGVAGLLIYVTTLFWFTLKTAKSSEGLTLAIFLMLSIRSISEVTLVISGYFNFDALAHLLLLMIIGAQLKSDNIKIADSSLTAHQKLVSFRGLC
jgi:exopolysaccharide production protein ExoQ